MNCISTKHGEHIFSPEPVENGEKNTSYFSQLEKSRQERNEICSLIINREGCTEPKHIATEVREF